MNITTTVTWDDLRADADAELSDLRDAHDELTDLATDEYGDGALNRPLPSDPDAVPEDHLRLWAIQQRAEQVDEAAKQLQKRKEVLAFLRDELGDDPFKIKMLTGEETMAIEAEIRGLAQSEDEPSPALVQLKRNGMTVDAATVDAPAGVPRAGDDEDDPLPSKAPNALTMALWQQVERFNTAGATDFRAAGIGERNRVASGPSGPSPTPSDAAPSVPDSAPDESD